MAALPNILDDDDARELAQALADAQRFRGALARPEVTGSWAEKIGWQLRAAEKWVDRLLGAPKARQW